MPTIIPTNTSTLVFDLGNVIVDIDYESVVAAFRRIALFDFRQLLTYNKQVQFFDEWEKGLVSTEKFRLHLREFLNPGTSDAEIDYAWNAMITNYPEKKFEMLLRLQDQYRVVALSNINPLHIAALDAGVQKHFGVPNMQHYFHATYYSCEMGCRKPEREIFELFLQKEKVAPESCFFIDDKKENTDVAASLGMHVFNLRQRDALCALLGF